MYQECDLWTAITTNVKYIISDQNVPLGGTDLSVLCLFRHISLDIFTKVTKQLYQKQLISCSFFRIVSLPYTWPASLDMRRLLEY